jgi:cell division protease FtsH
VSVEERFLAAVEDSEEPAAAGWRERQRQILERKNRAAIDDFLGEGGRSNAVGIVPRYYGGLLTWALHRYMERERWKIATTLGYRGPEPIYIDVATGAGSCENLLMDGQLLVEKGDARFIVTVDVHPGSRGSFQVEGPVDKEEEIAAFVGGVMTIAREENFYRGEKIEFAGRIRFLNVVDKSWDTIILDRAIKREVKANTIDFLKRRKRWAKYGIPQKRGVLLAGEPGTGKTLICKALMAEADGITCITTNAYALSADEYITELYEMAQDLSPCIVFIEDIDLIGLNREEYHYQHGPALLSLLTVLDGVEEKQGIVTVGTTNNLKTLDRAISQRPSRFDRVIKLSLPSLEERGELVGLLCQKIPIGDPTQDYIAHKTDGCTPAQLREVIYSLAIEYPDEPLDAAPPLLELSKDDVDSAISRINGRNRRRLGFGIDNNHDGNRSDLIPAIKLS